MCALYIVHEIIHKPLQAFIYKIWRCVSLTWYAACHELCYGWVQMLDGKI